jgi:hypothetical protein
MPSYEEPINSVSPSLSINDSRVEKRLTRRRLYSIMTIVVGEWHDEILVWAVVAMFSKKGGKL